ncbi:MAG: peptidase C39 family protein [Nocardioidaceae bacterium]
MVSQKRERLCVSRASRLVERPNSPGTWIELAVWVTGCDDGGEQQNERFVLGRWAETTDTIHRTSVPGQSTALAEVDCDVLKAHRPAGLSTWQIELSLCRARGSTATPTVCLVGAVISRLALHEDELPPNGEGVSTSGVNLGVPPLSQTTHRGTYPEFDGGGEAWCSPASTSMVLAFWQRGPNPADYAWLDPAYPDPEVAHAAAGSYDYAYQGCGNWSFNTAYAARFSVTAYVHRLQSLAEAELYIRAGIPLVVSVSFDEAELTGAGYSTRGHLLVLCGFTEDGDVIVNDPASHLVASNDEVRTVYQRAQFERAWLPKSGTAYVVHP